MEAISKSGKRLHGKIAEILVKKGSATPFEEGKAPVKKVKKATPKKTKAPKKAVKKVKK